MTFLHTGAQATQKQADLAMKQAKWAAYAAAKVTAIVAHETGMGGGNIDEIRGFINDVWAPKHQSLIKGNARTISYVPPAPESDMPKSPVIARPPPEGPPPRSGMPPPPGHTPVGVKPKGAPSPSAPAPKKKAPSP